MQLAVVDQQCNCCPTCTAGLSGASGPCPASDALVPGDAAALGTGDAASSPETAGARLGASPGAPAAPPATPRCAGLGAGGAGGCGCDCGVGAGAVEAAASPSPRPHAATTLVASLAPVPAGGGGGDMAAAPRAVMPEPVLPREGSSEPPELLAARPTSPGSRPLPSGLP
jgi:hypothetical protein